MVKEGSQEIRMDRKDSKDRSITLDLV
jgi:hypothetical protein